MRRVRLDAFGEDNKSNRVPRIPDFDDVGEKFWDGALDAEFAKTTAFSAITDFLGKLKMNNVKAYKTEAGRVTVVGNGYAIQYQYIDENALTEPAPAPEPAPEPEPPPPPPEPEAEAPVKEAPSETFLHAFALPFSIVSTNPKGEDIDKDQITIGICRAMILYLKGMITGRGSETGSLD